MEILNVLKEILIVQLGVNSTLFIQMGIFFACYLVLNQLVFKPYLALIHARAAKTVGLKEKAEADREVGLKSKAEYETFMKAERKKISQTVDQERTRIAESERAVIQAARGEAAEELGVLRGQIQKEFDSARKQLQPLVSDYSSQIVSKLVGKTVKVTANLKNDKVREEEQTV